MIVLAILFLILAVALVSLLWRLKKFWKEQSGQRKPLSVKEAFTRHSEFATWFASYGTAQKNMLQKAMSKKGWEKKFQQDAKNDPRFKKMKKDAKSVEQMGKSMEFSVKYVLPVLTVLAKYGIQILAVLLILFVVFLVWGIVTF